MFLVLQALNVGLKVRSKVDLELRKVFSLKLRQKAAISQARRDKNYECTSYETKTFKQVSIIVPNSDWMWI